MRIGIWYALVPTVLLVAVPASAQTPGFNAFGGKPAQQQTAPKPTLPPALPGAAPNANRAAPSFRPPTDMEPTDALFDAINRGDIAAAREAISRGADLNGHNILGMTPMELSVDLGRNDISFLLLSMRGADDLRSRRAAAETAAKPAPTKPVKQAARPAKGTTQMQPPATPQTARLFSGDGGAPIPNAGFLGFDSGRR
jgi:hypothetical protein